MKNTTVQRNYIVKIEINKEWYESKSFAFIEDAEVYVSWTTAPAKIFHRTTTIEEEEIQ